MATKPDITNLPVNEPCIISDVFCGVLVRIERFAGFARLVFAVPQTLQWGTEEKTAVELAVVAKLIVPAEMLPAMADRLLGEDQMIAHAALPASRRLPN